MATLTVEEFYYRTTPNQESYEINNILSLVVTDLIEVIPPPIDDKPRLIILPLLYSKIILHSSSLLHQEDHISLFLVHKSIILTLFYNNSSTALVFSACLGVAKITELLLHLKNATVAANRSTSDLLCTASKYGHADWVKTLMKNRDIYLRIQKMIQLTPLSHSAALHTRAECVK